MTPNATIQKPKGLKVHEKALKERKAAKRAAATAVSKEKTIKSPVVKAQNARDTVEDASHISTTSPDDVAPCKEIVQADRMTIAVASPPTIEVAAKAIPSVWPCHSLHPLLSLDGNKDVEAVDARTGADDVAPDMPQKQAIDTVPVTVTDAIISAAAPSVDVNDNLITGTDSDSHKAIGIAQDKRAGEENADIEIAPPAKAFDIHAHRKALEAALYANMEIPKEMLTRLKHTITADVEFNTDIYEQVIDLVVDELDVVTTCLANKKSVDDNNFEAIAMPAISLGEPAMPASMSRDKLFALVADAGVGVVGSSNAEIVLMLEDLERATLLEVAPAKILEGALSMRNSALSIELSPKTLRRMRSMFGGQARPLRSLALWSLSRPK
jgi:hypothetical protein